MVVRARQDAVKRAQVGPFQMRLALKLWRSCAGSGGGAPGLKCLQQDYLAKLRDKLENELRELGRCAARAADAATPASVDWVGCLGLRSVMLGPKQLHKAMEDSSFVWRSMYAAHLRGWLRLYPPSRLLVSDPASLLRPSDAPAAMRRMAAFAGLPTSGTSGRTTSSTRDELLTKASPGAAEAGAREGVHENSRRYLLGRPAPPELTRRLREWLRPHQCDLAGLVRRHALLATPEVLPWLREELESMGGGVCAGVNVVDEWFVGAS
jgi:hypothetical protein